MKFLVDQCAGQRLAEWLRGEGHDVVETRERGPDPGDRAILAWAAAESRVLVTMDKDFGLFIFAEGAPCAGLVRLPHVRSTTRIALMRKVLSAYGDKLTQGAVATVQENRVRISWPEAG